MKLKVWLFILLIINANFWNLKFFSFLTDYDTLVILNMIMLIYGYYHYKRKNFIDAKKYSWFYKMIFAAMILSAMSIVVFHDQKLIDTIFVYRAQLPLLFMPLLFRIQPSIEDIKKAITWATIAFIIFSYLSLITPQLFASAVPDSSSERDFGYNFLAMGNGMLWLYLFCFLISNLSDKYTRKQFILLGVFIVTVIVAQNRQTIIYVFCIILFFFFSKSRHKSVKVILIAFFITAILYNFNIITSLYLETLDNTHLEAGRAVSLPYFLFEHNQNFIIDIIGNGMDSKKSAYGQYLTELGKNYAIWAGDIGIVGIWSIYGILPVVAILLLSIKVFKARKYMPQYVIYIAAATFLCPYLLSLAGKNVYWWAFLLYFYAYYDTLRKKKFAHRGIIDETHQTIKKWTNLQKKNFIHRCM